MLLPLPLLVLRLTRNRNFFAFPARQTEAELRWMVIWITGPTFSENRTLQKKKTKKKRNGEVSRNQGCMINNHHKRLIRNIFISPKAIEAQVDR